jgi:hypothetical protein
LKTGPWKNLETGTFDDAGRGRHYGFPAIRNEIPMYIPEHFAEHRPGQLHRIIRDNPLGILVMAGVSGMDADPIPFEYKESACWNWN